MLGVAVGAAGASSAAASTAAQLAASGDFGRAIAIDEQISERSGPLYFFDSSAASDAVKAAERTLLAWAAALGRAGDIDAAVALYRSEHAPSLRLEATNAVGALLLKAAAADAARGAYPSAILRLQQVERLAAGTAAALQAERQLPVDEAGEARMLIAAGHPADAMATLDAVVKEGSVEATRTADSIYPTAPPGSREGGDHRPLRQGGPRRSPAGGVQLSPERAGHTGTRAAGRAADRLGNPRQQHRHGDRGAGPPEHPLHG